jgi:tetratricopeptide (TPR) repeat protein
MPYIRERGNQLCLVHGAREHGTGKVKQGILFTIYSKEEALAAIEKSDKGKPFSFKLLLEHDNPDMKFDWKTIYSDIEKGLHVLPATFEYAPTRHIDQFYPAVKSFAEVLIQTDCQEMLPAAELVREHKLKLEYLKHLIDWRIKTCDQKANSFNQDNPFFWRTASRRRDLPYESFDYIESLYFKGKFDEAEAALTLVTDCFEGYADGYNYLGLIQRERGKLKEAILFFRKAIEVGKTKLRRRVAKKDWWCDHSARPYMRGLINLADALNRSESYDEAHQICDQLEHQCNSRDHAEPIRAITYLNQGNWKKAYASAQHLHRIVESESFVAAFAAYELGQHLEALTHFVFASLNTPFAANLMADVRVGQPKNYDEQEEHNAAVGIWNATIPFRERHQKSRKFFQKVVKDVRLISLLKEIRELKKQLHERRDESRRPFFDKHMQMRQWEYAAQKAAEMVDLLKPIRPAPVGSKAHVH